MASSLTADARKKANLRVLQRLDASVLDIVDSASHVVLYEFQQTEQKWEKKNVDGSLFLVKKSEQPRFQLVILNRSSADNWSLPILLGFQMQDSDPFLIFRQNDQDNNGGESILGIWFHDAKERVAFAQLLDKVAKSLEYVAESDKNHVPLQVDQGAAAAALLSPLSLNENNATTPQTKATPAAASVNEQHSTGGPQQAQQQQQPLVLDKKSLQLALLSLIQDDRFLDLIHAQYLKVAHARSSRKPPSNN
mmetsp:Transcript_14842/g.23194  ORF Transcript_14842/g.23194 Transcript_14842/m.23194 type:complete len:250 (-) Transcript_14842:3695-4444(-)